MQIKLKSSDEQVFEVQEEVALMSATIGNFIEDISGMLTGAGTSFK